MKEQTGPYAKDKLDVTVEKHTQVNGAVLNSDTGQLTLDTGTLGFGDIKDHDRATSTSGQVAVGIGLQQNGTGQDGQPSGTVSGSYASHDIEQTTKATIGEGTGRSLLIDPFTACRLKGLDLHSVSLVAGGSLRIADKHSVNRARFWTGQHRNSLKTRPRVRY